MPRRAPDSRALSVIEAIDRQTPFESADADERHLHQLLTTGETAAPEVEEAFEFWHSPETRHVLNALILAKATDEQLAAGLGFSPTVLSPYRNLFFDRSVFRNDLDCGIYVRNLQVDPDTRQHYTTAIQQGPEFLINRFRVGTRPNVAARTVLQSVLNDSYDRFLAHRGLELDAAKTKEALRWGQQAVSTARDVIDKGTDERGNVLSELHAIFLETKELTETPEQADIDPKQVL